MKKTYILAGIVVFVLLVMAGVLFVWLQKEKESAQEEQKSLGSELYQNPADKIPDVNPFKEEINPFDAAKVNPFEKTYKNPFK